MPCLSAHKDVIVFSTAHEANKDAHYRGRSSGLTHTEVVMMGSILILVINLASDHSKEVCKGAAIKLGINTDAAPGGSDKVQENRLRSCCPNRIVIDLFRQRYNYDGRSLSPPVELISCLLPRPLI